jgi:hypothetical protein
VPRCQPVRSIQPCIVGSIQDGFLHLRCHPRVARPRAKSVIARYIAGACRARTWRRPQGGNQQGRDHRAQGCSGSARPARARAKSDRGPARGRPRSRHSRYPARRDCAAPFAVRRGPESVRGRTGNATHAAGSDTAKSGLARRSDRTTGRNSSGSATTGPQDLPPSEIIAAKVSGTPGRGAEAQEVAIPSRAALREIDASANAERKKPPRRTAFRSKAEIPATYLGCGDRI